MSLTAVDERFDMETDEVIREDTPFDMEAEEDNAAEDNAIVDKLFGNDECDDERDG